MTHLAADLTYPIQHYLTTGVSSKIQSAGPVDPCRALHGLIVLYEN